MFLFYDCLWTLDGICAGTTLGEFFFWTFNYQDFFDLSKIEYYGHLLDLAEQEQQ